MRDKSKRLWGNGRVMGMRVKGLRKPVYIRLGTSDLHVFQEIFLDSEYEAVRCQAVGDARTIVDLGSNIGISIRYWRMLFPDATIVAVEPDNANMAVCRRNALAAGGPETKLIQACVAGTRRKVSLDRNNAAWAFKIQDTPAPSDTPGTADQIDALTMVEVLAQAGVTGPIDLLKCDIEGAEAEVFADCAEWIRRVRTLIIELHAPYTRDRLLSDLRRGGFTGKVSSLKEIDDVHVLMIEREAK